MPEIVTLSSGVERVLQVLRPHSRPETSFPNGLSANATRRPAGESLRDWFVRLVDTYGGKDPAHVALEENIAIFASLRWKGDDLVYASVPALVATSCSLEDFYLEDGHEAVYMRLDVDYDTLGTPFSHPLAHVHVEGDAQPRFALDGGKSGNVLLDYLEFIYRTYSPGKWLAWAGQTWRASRDDETTFQTITDAFEDGAFAVLRANAKQVDRVKQVLREAKDSAFKNHLSGFDRGILEYPTAGK